MKLTDSMPIHVVIHVDRRGVGAAGGKSMITFVTDPDGYRFELIERTEAGTGAGFQVT